MNLTVAYCLDDHVVPRIWLGLEASSIEIIIIELCLGLFMLI